MVHKKAKDLLILLGIVAGACITVLYFNFNPSEHNFFPKCPFYSITTLYCPGCGSQRAIHKLLHGDITGAFKHNLLILLLFLVLIYDLIIYFLKRSFQKDFKNVLHQPKITMSILIIVVAFWVLRNINYYPFSILAP